MTQENETIYEVIEGIYAATEKVYLSLMRFLSEIESGERAQYKTLDNCVCITRVDYDRLTPLLKAKARIKWDMDDGNVILSTCPTLDGIAIAGNIVYINIPKGEVNIHRMEAMLTELFISYKEQMQKRIVDAILLKKE